MRTQSDEDGSFSFVSEEEAIELEISAPGYPATTILAEPVNVEDDAPLIVELARGGWIKVVVWDEDGAGPCVGCSVSVTGPKPDDAGMLTNAAGEALSETLPPGEYQVYLERIRSLGSIITRSGGDNIRMAMVRPDETTTITFGERRYSVRLLINPAPGPEWSLMAVAGSDIRSYKSDGTGIYELKRPAGEPLQLKLSKQWSASVELAILAGDDTRSDITLELPATLVSGVLTREETPAPHQELGLVSLTDNRSVAWALSDANGAFAVPFIAPGSYAVVVQGASIRMFAVSQNDTVELGNIEVPQEG